MNKNNTVDNIVVNSLSDSRELDYYQLFGAIDRTLFADKGGVEVDYALEDSLDRLVSAGRVVYVDTGKQFGSYLYSLAGA